MSLSSTTSRISYTGNGAVSTYSYTFKVFSQSDLLVTVRNTSGVETTLTIATDYTVTGVGDTGGGTIVLVNASQAWLTAGKLTTGYVLTIRRVPSLVQTTDIRNQGDFYPESHEDTFDQLVMIDQKQQDEIDRSMKLPETVSSADFDPTLPSGIAGSADKVPVTNATGDGWAAASAWIDSGDISAAAASAAAAAASASAAAASAVEASSSETTASEWASKTTGQVATTDYSAKAWAIGGTGVTDTASAGAAKEWATETASTVDGTDYSAKEWAKGTQTRGAASGGSAKDWANYTGGTVDNSEYSAKKYAADAAASAASAAAQLASAFFRDVVYITSADSPRTITSADNGKLFNINSSGGAISFTLPTIASTTLPFNVSFKLTTAGNTVTINRSSTDTIEGATSATLATAGQGLDLIADADGSPDNWSMISTPGTVLPIANGGTNATTKAGAFDSLSPMTTGGDLIYGGASGTGTRLPNGSLRNVLMSAGGTSAPFWSVFPPPPSFQRYTTAGSGTYNLHYAFTISSGSATAGATYTHNSVTYTVVTTVSSATLVYMSGSSAPLTSGTLTKASGTGDSTLTFSLSWVPVELVVTVIGPGGGGAGSGSAGGGNGGNATTASSFGSSLLTANGGNGGNWAGPGGTGGSVTINSPAIKIVGVEGGAGAGVSGALENYPCGGNGGNSIFGGGGRGGSTTGSVGCAETGAGGGGSGVNLNTMAAGAGGAAGGSIIASLRSPSATYAYVVGGGGTGGTAGTSGFAGAVGSDGLVMVKAKYI